MMWDFDYDVNLEEIKGERKQNRKLMEMLNDTFLPQHIEDIARVESDNNTTCILDLELATDENMVNKVTAREGFHKIGSPNK